MRANHKRPRKAPSPKTSQSPEKSALSKVPEQTGIPLKPKEIPRLIVHTTDKVKIQDELLNTMPEPMGQLPKEPDKAIQY